MAGGILFAERKETRDVNTTDNLDRIICYGFGNAVGQ
uniref:Uncharacterized protein n=1 Tax=Myoviridae sp. ctguh8 TaxID=2826682 RepID=A0A8S5MEE5_9CAUD|nr:MAG TPA: hypothetical protein [Myoviridae sp. ctguh8]